MKLKYKYRILIADVDDEILSALKTLLEQEGYAVETAKRAIDAFEKIQNDKYHIVIIDMDMPDMNGIELLKEIKSYDALTQVIMTAGNSTMEKILGSLEYGANDYIMKPFESMEHVKNIVECSIRKLERWTEAIVKIVE